MWALSVWALRSAIAPLTQIFQRGQLEVVVATVSVVLTPAAASALNFDRPVLPLVTVGLSRFIFLLKRLGLKLLRIII